jgi:hypothetical protein
MMRCPACDFPNTGAATYCRRCGTVVDDAPAEQQDTVRFSVDVGAPPVDPPRVGAKYPTLIVRAGGGRAGESFELSGDQMLIGRSPAAEVFLDDVTVSREHAVLIRRHGDLYIDDLGSLNGTYVNRRRVDSQRLADADELQVGKYKLTYVNG